MHDVHLYIKHFLLAWAIYPNPSVHIQATYVRAVHIQATYVRVSTDDLRLIFMVWSSATCFSSLKTDEVYFISLEKLSLHWQLH